MSSNGTPQGYLSRVRGTNDTTRDRSAEQANTTSGNPYGYSNMTTPTPPTNRYIPPTFNPVSGQWNTNGGDYQLPNAWNGSQQVPNWQPNFNFNWGSQSPPSAPPGTQQPPQNTAPPAPITQPSVASQKPQVPTVAPPATSPAPVVPQITPQQSFGYNGLGGIAPPPSTPMSLGPINSALNSAQNAKLGTPSVAGPPSTGTAVPANAMPQITQAQAIAMYGPGAGGLSQGSARYMPTLQR